MRHNFLRTYGNLPEWKKILSFINSPSKDTLIFGNIEFNYNLKSKDLTGSWTGSIISKKIDDDQFVIESRVKHNAQFSKDHVQKIQNVVREPLKNVSQADAQNDDEELKSQDRIETGFYNWLKSPNTTKFLSLIPLTSTSDWNSSIQLSRMNFSVKKASFDYSLLGARKTGLLVNVDYQNDVLKSLITISGGRPLYDHAIALYNSFAQSVKSLENYPMDFPQFSDQNKDDLFKLLTKYSEQPEKANTELKFAIKYDNDGVKVGNKDLSLLVSDLATFYTKFSSGKTKQAPEEIQILIVPETELQEVR